MIIMSKFTVLLAAVILSVFVDKGLCRFAGSESLGQLSGALTQNDLSEVSEFRRQKHINKSPTDRNASHVAPDKFITAGRPTGIAQYPWVVYLNIKIREWTGTKVTMCGGSLISSRHVITAAHCVDFPIRYYEDVSLYLAEYNTRTFPTDCVGRQCIRNVLMHPDKITIHHRYQRNPVNNDIALLRLRGSAPNTDYIRPISLPTFNINDPRYEGTSLTVTGWGRTEKGHASSIKLHAQVQLIALNTCRKYHPVTEGMLCAAGRNGQDSCFGDSGGPIMMERQGNFYLAGIVSFGFPECGKSLPAVYTNVFTYLDWIQKAIRD